MSHPISEVHWQDLALYPPDPPHGIFLIAVIDECDPNGTLLVMEAERDARGWIVMGDTEQDPKGIVYWAEMPAVPNPRAPRGCASAA